MCCLSLGTGQHPAGGTGVWGEQRGLGRAGGARSAGAAPRGSTRRPEPAPASPQVPIHALWNDGRENLLGNITTKSSKSHIHNYMYITFPSSAFYCLQS